MLDMKWMYVAIAAVAIAAIIGVTVGDMYDQQVKIEQIKLEQSSCCKLIEGVVIK